MRTFKSSQQQLHAKIVQHVRHGRAASRGKLAEVLEIAPSTMGLHVEELVRQGFLIESGMEQGAVGRPKRLLRLMPDAGWFAGVEFTGGRLQAVRVDFAGRQRGALTESMPSKMSSEEVLERIGSAVEKLQSSAPGTLLGIGVGSPGFVDPVTGEVMYSQFQPDWKHIPLVARLRQRFPVRVTVENNLHVITLAEKWFGGGRDELDFVIVRARHGFGLGVVKEGRLLPGAHHATGEIGMLPWPLDGSSGMQVHDALSARTIWCHLSGTSSSVRAPADLHAALAKFADASGAAWDAAVSDYARVLGMIQLMVDARVFFLHGPLTALGERFCREIMKRSVVLIPALRHCPIQLRLTALGEEAGALGAASLAMESWNPDENEA